MTESFAATEIHWRSLPFSELTTRELHDLVRLRINVFVVEQNCVYPELDGKDEVALHLLGCSPEGELLAYARVLPEGSKYAEVSFGRVVVDPAMRGTGLGHMVVEHTLRLIEKQWGPVPVRISAQSHLQAYYQKHSFSTVGSSYLEDGIPHVEMLRTV